MEYQNNTESLEKYISEYVPDAARIGLVVAVEMSAVKRKYGYADEVFHQLIGMGEGSKAQALQNVTDAIAFLRLAQHAEGIVDVALAVTDSTQQGCGKIISCQNFVQNGIFFRNGDLRHGGFLLIKYSCFLLFYVLDNPQLKYAKIRAFSLCFVPVYHRKNPHATVFAGIIFKKYRANLYNLESFPLLKYTILLNRPNIEPQRPDFSLTYLRFAVYLV